MVIAGECLCRSIWTGYSAIPADPVVSEGLLPIQVALSIPIVRILSHPTVCGPICASHALDLQSFPAEKGASDGEDGSSGAAHVGPPSVNIEAKLVGVDDADMEKKADPVGKVSSPRQAKFYQIEN